MRTDLLFKKEPLFGLDIGSHTIKMVQIKKAGKSTKLLGYSNVPIPHDAIVEGIIADPEALAEATLSAIKKPNWGKINTRHVALALPEARVFTRIISLPIMEQEQLAEAIRWETQQYVPMPIDDLYTDYEVVGQAPAQGSGDPNQEVLLVAAPRAIVDSYIKFCEILNLTPSVIELSLGAVVRADIPLAQTAGHTLVADLGSVSTDIAIYNKSLKLTASVPIGGDKFTEIIQDKLKISAEQAEEVKCKFGLGESDLKSKISAAISPQLTTLVAELRKVIKFYEQRGTKQNDHKIESILLAGGGAGMPGLTEYLENALGTNVAVGNPWQSLNTYPLKPLPRNVASIYTTAIGLALNEVRP